MKRIYLTYSRDIGDFKHNLTELSKRGLYGIRLINKGKTAEELISRTEEILEYTRKNNFKLDILIDLPGEKAIIGKLGDGVKIEKGKTYILCGKKYDSAKKEIPTINFLNRIDRKKIFQGDVVSIADGEVDMEIVSISDESVSCVALNDFHLTSNRSFNIKGDKLPAYPVSEDDRLLLEKLKSSEISKQVKILVSFVTEASHVKSVKDISPDFRVVSKIENIIDDKNLGEIINASDSLMLGRGDLTSTSKMSEVFLFQKNIIKKCNISNKELIVATGLFGDLKNSGKPSISDIMDFGFLRSLNVNSFLIAGSNAGHYPFETLELIRDFEKF